MTGWGRKGLLLGLALACLAGSSLFQGRLNRLRASAGLTRVTPLENAPPVLAFTTVALGGFRGLIANALWIRANDLQQEGKYFEKVQLASWITKLEPHFAHVWVVQAWDMAYNISVKFQAPADRWRWLQRGIELLRDDGLRYNPTESLIYRELSWFYQHKIGQNMDDAHWHYKSQWAVAMTNVLGNGRPNFDELINPPTDELRQRVKLLREKFKLDPVRMQKYDGLYGPFDWRLPEAHAVYWAAMGLEFAREKDQVTLRRSIYQSMQAAMLRGRLQFVETGRGVLLETGPDLSIADKANETFDKMIAEEPSSPQRDGFRRAHRNFMRELVYLSYTHNRPQAAELWWRRLKEKYPDAVPPNMTVEEYSLNRVADGIKDFGYDRMVALLEGFWRKHYFQLAIDNDEHAAGLDMMAIRSWTFYHNKSGGQERLRLPSIPRMKQQILDKWIDPGNGMDPLLVARLRSRLGLQLVPTNAPPTNAPRQ